MTEDFRLQLIEQTPEINRCPHLRTDSVGPYCSKLVKDGRTEDARLPCDSASLQLWCLNKENYQNCVVYKNK